MKLLRISFLGATYSLIGHNTAWAQNTGCSESLKTDLTTLRGDEAALRETTSAQLSCLLDRPHAPLKDALSVTRQYFDLSKEPACQILLLDSKLHVRAAQQIEDVAEPSPEQRDALGRHWRAAWEMAAELSYAWAQRSTEDEAAFRACVLPARQILKNFPAVTITIDPETADNYELWWDGFLRGDSLPRILPNRHHELTIDPPPNHGVTVWIDQGCPKSAPGKLTIYPSTRYHDPYGTHQIRVVFTPLDEYPPPNATCDAPPESEIAAPGPTKVKPQQATASPYLPVLFWPGVGVAAAGAIGLGVSLIQANSHETEAASLYKSGDCANTNASSCQVDQINSEYDDADSWNRWAIASGVVLGVGAAAIGASFLFADDPTPPAAGMHMRPFFYGTPSFAFGGVRGQF